MEEGKRIIHYLINYPYYAEGKSEQGQHGRFLAAPKGSAVVSGGETTLLCSALPMKPQSQRNRGKRFGRVQNSSFSSVTSMCPSAPGKSLILTTLSPVFLLFPHQFPSWCV